MAHETSSALSSPELECVALLSRNAAATTAAVFVHGFNGDAEMTWDGFRDVVARSDRWDDWDFYFLGYKSTRERVGMTALKLTEFVGEIFPSPPADLVEGEDPWTGETVWLRDPDETRYERLVLVGHSQGGVVIRKAVLEAARSAGNKRGQGRHPICGAELRLFAPALFGVELSGWPGVAKSIGGLWTYVHLRLVHSPSFHELQVGSTLLTRLQEGTERLAGRLLTMSALRSRIQWAGKDDFVVGFERYECDPPYEGVEEATHTSICKPAILGNKPLKFLSGS